MGLAWDPSPDPTAVGYKVYYGVASGVYTNSIDVSSATNTTITGLVAGATYYFVVTAYNSSGVESLPSNEVSYTVPVASGNQPPTLNIIYNVTVNEDAGQQTVTLSGISSGSSTENQTLSVTASSSNTGLIPNPTVTYTSPNTTGTISFTPVANAFGTATITVTVDDGQTSNNTISRTFTVTVNPVNDPPTLNAIGNVTINENAGQQTINLSGISSGAANENQTLSVKASSSKTSLIPTPTVTYTSPNSTGTLRFTPAANTHGTATITVTVNDGQSANNTYSRTFTVTVNALPTISAIPDLTVYANTNSGPVPFTISDAETPAANLTLSAASSNPSLITTGNIVFGGSGANRTVTLTPLAGQTGAANITVTVSDGSATASRTFQLTVQNSPPLPPENLVIVTTNGLGSITPNPASMKQVLGNTYSLTAVPGSGQEFAGWTGSVNSSNPKLTFVLTSNMVLHANFVTSPYVAADGVYNGLFYEDSGVELASSGSFQLKVTSRGTYSCRLLLNGQRSSFSGKMDLSLTATNSARRGKSPPLAVQLRVGNSGSEAGHVYGTVSDGNWVATLQGDRAAFNAKKNPAPYAGNYTWILPGSDSGNPSLPAGHSYGVLRVGANGLVKLSGTLADGTKVSQSTAVSADGVWPLCVAFRSGQGLAISWVTFTNTSTADLSGNLDWIRLPNAKSRLYAAGFTNETILLGSAFTKPVNSNILNLSKADLEFAGGDLGSGFTNAITFEAKSKIINASSNKLSLNFSASKGTFKGKVTDPLSEQALPFGGVVFQKLNTAYGFLPGTSQSSQVNLAP